MMAEHDPLAATRDPRLVVVQECASTNDLARERLADSSAESGSAFVALHQTRGRTLGGDDWVTPGGEALTMSVVVESPPLPVALWPAVAVHDALSLLGVRAGLKWPNDVLVGRRKIAGILVEQAACWHIIGIGLNIRQRSFPPPLDDTATSIALETQSGPPGVLETASAVLDALDLARDFDLVSAWSERSNMLGRPIDYRRGSDGWRRATAVAIGPHGDLVVRYPDGSEAAWHSAHDLDVRPVDNAG
ncbi:MAG: biotin--[acetyl-CoA-carboxylase] ligase [Planctomycetota bacterium]